MKKAKKVKAKNMFKNFPITGVSREDLSFAGFRAGQVSDEIMEHIANKMADTYVENSFWIDLEYIANDLEIKRKKYEK